MILAVRPIVSIPLPNSPAPPPLPIPGIADFKEAASRFDRAAEIPINPASSSLIGSVAGAATDALDRGLDQLKQAAIPSGWNSIVRTNFELAKKGIMAARNDAYHAGFDIPSDSVHGYGAVPHTIASDAEAVKQGYGVPSSQQKDAWQLDFRRGAHAARAGLAWIDKLTAE